jgi:tungstate transport system substrate-binding protein
MSGLSAVYREPAKRLLLVATVFLALFCLALAVYQAGEGAVRIRVATATTLYDTGLLEFVSSRFTESTGYTVILLPVGTGEALRRAEMGDACVVITHDPAAESRFLEKGVIGGRRIVAFNSFVVAGPPDDPARVSGTRSIVEAFERIYAAGEEVGSLFVSRGDESGTHSREKLVWRLSGLSPYERAWYIESGAGMAHTLLLANEKRAYVLSDIGTFAFLKAKGRLPNLAVLYYNESDGLTLNIYSAYLSSLCSGQERLAALVFLEFLETEAQDLIGSYRVGGASVRLFTPARDYEGPGAGLEEAWARLSMLGEG